MSPMNQHATLSTIMADVAVLLFLAHFELSRLMWAYLIWFNIGLAVCRHQGIYPPPPARLSFRWGLRTIWWRAWWPKYLLGT